MLKILVFILLIIVLGIALVIIMFWRQARKQPPAYGLIVEKYYVCPVQQNLYGGIFGKGPTQEFHGKNTRAWCWKHEWKEIDRKTFKQLATEWYGKDWSQDIPFWQED